MELDFNFGGDVKVRSHTYTLFQGNCCRRRLFHAVQGSVQRKARVTTTPIQSVLGWLALTGCDLALARDEKSKSHLLIGLEHPSRLFLKHTRLVRTNLHTPSQAESSRVTKETPIGFPYCFVRARCAELTLKYLS